MPGCRAERYCGGFTVVELMAVIGVTAVVVAVGYSAWRTHAVRTQIADALASLNPLQTAVVSAFQATGEVPRDVAELGRAVLLSEQIGAYVTSISVQDGRIDLDFGRQADAAIAGRRLSLTPHETASAQVVWLCGNEIPGPDLHPLGFAGGGRQAVQIPTTVEARFLPPGCR
jgi:type IV pilus assembly protein PilA